MLGAIVKSAGGKLAKQQVKKVAKDKLMGRKKKPTASKETAENMVTSTATEKGKPSNKRNLFPKAKLPAKDPQKLQAVQAEIDAKETDKRIVKISKDVTAIAEAMKGGLVLKDKAAAKARKAAERDKRAAQEADVEKPDEPKKEGGGIGKVKVPGVGLLSGVFGFITKFIYGIVIMKLIEFAPQLKKVLGLFKLAQPLFNVVTGLVGGAFDLLATFVDFGYKIADGAEKMVGKIFGEEGAKKFNTFMENVRNLINGAIVLKFVYERIIKGVIKNIKNAFKLVKNFIKRGLKLASKLFPNVAKGATKLLQAGKGLVGKGVAKVGGFAAKIFGKAASFIAPGFKAAKPFASKFFSKIPIVGPLVITIVSLLSGEPATQAIFKGLGAALGGALGTFIPIPILGTLIGETIGVFVGDLFYELLFGGGIQGVGQKLKDTFMTLFKGGKAVANWLGGGIKAFINNVLKTDPIKIPSGGGVRATATLAANKLGLYNFLEGLGFAEGKNGQIDKFINPLNLLNPLKFYPLLFKSFFGKRDEGESSGGETATVTPKEDAKTDLVLDDVQGGKSGDANQVAKETTYEEDAGGVKFIPVPVVQSTPVTVKNRGGGSRSGSRTFMIDETELALYGGK